MVNPNTRVFALLCTGFLAACGGSSPFISGTSEDTAAPTTTSTTTTVPETLAQNVVSFTYSASDSELTVQLESIDASPITATLTRTTSLDFGKYDAYTFQERAETRHFTAYVGSSADASLVAGVIADGGLNNRYFGGGFFERSGSYTQPSTGLVTYAGDYVAVTNVDAPGALLINNSFANSALQPAQSGTVQGKIVIQASFADLKVDGRIIDRVLLPGDSDVSLVDVVFVDGTIATDGTFSGTAENPSQETIGVYGGIFSTNGNAVAGTTKLDSFIATVDGEEEIGLFVLENCAGANAADFCNNF